MLSENPERQIEESSVGMDKGPSTSAMRKVSRAGVALCPTCSLPLQAHPSADERPSHWTITTFGHALRCDVRCAGTSSPLTLSTQGAP